MLTMFFVSLSASGNTYFLVRSEAHKHIGLCTGEGAHTASSSTGDSKG